MEFINQQILADGMKHVEEAGLEDVLMSPMIEASRSWCRDLRTEGDGVDDESFLKLGVQRIMRNNESGRDFFQKASDCLDLPIERSAFFDLFRSARRLGVLKDTAAGLYDDGCRLLEIDTLARFPQLKGIEVIAGDGHLLSAACHAPRSPNGKKVASNSIHMLNIRNGLLFPLSAVQGDGRHAHELPALRRTMPRILKKLRRGKANLKDVILLLDMAYNDTAFWSRMKYAKDAGAKVIMPQKSNLEAIPLEEVEFDRDDPINIGVVSVELVAFNNVHSSTMHRVVYRDPETGTEYVFLTTAMDLAPGLVAFLYLLRWRIEKVFDVFKNKLHEKKAWGNGQVCQQIQATFACVAHNLLVMFSAGLKRTYGIEPTKLQRKRDRAFEQREKNAAKNGRFVNPIVKMIEYPSQLSCQFIRSVRNGIDLRKTLREHLQPLRAAMEVYM
jgi:hypothetical protein